MLERGVQGQVLDVIGNKEYNESMDTYQTLQADRRQFLALTGLTVPEFQLMLTAFPRAYQRLYPANQSTEGHPRQPCGGGAGEGHRQRREYKIMGTRSVPN